MVQGPTKKVDRQMQKMILDSLGEGLYVWYVIDLQGRLYDRRSYTCYERNDKSMIAEKRDDTEFELDDFE